MILLVTTSSLSLAAGSAPKPDDWVQFVIFGVVILGSVISGLVNAARKKMAQGNDRREVLKRHVEISNREADGVEQPFPQTEYQRPVARPMPPSAPPVVSPMRPVAQSAAELVKMLRERIEAQAGEKAEARKARNVTIESRREPTLEVQRAAQPRQRTAQPRQPIAASRGPSQTPQRRTTSPTAQPQAPAESRGSSSRAVRPLAGADEIAERERSQDQYVERRIGTVGAHIGPSPGDANAMTTTSNLKLDRISLRRAIIMNELLGPPLALRDLFESTDY